MYKVCESIYSLLTFFASIKTVFIFDYTTSTHYLELQKCNTYFMLHRELHHIMWQNVFAIVMAGQFSLKFPLTFMPQIPINTHGWRLFPPCTELITLDPYKYVIFWTIKKMHRSIYSACSALYYENNTNKKS